MRRGRKEREERTEGGHFDFAAHVVLLLRCPAVDYIVRVLWLLWRVQLLALALCVGRELRREGGRGEVEGDVDRVKVTVHHDDEVAKSVLSSSRCALVEMRVKLRKLRRERIDER